MSDINSLEQAESLPAFLGSRLNPTQAEACGRRGGAIGSRFGGGPSAICKEVPVGAGAVIGGLGEQDPFFGSIEYRLNSPTYSAATGIVHITWTLPTPFPESYVRNEVFLTGPPPKPVGFTLYYSSSNDIRTAKSIFCPSATPPGEVKLVVPLNSYVWGVSSGAADHQSSSYTSTDLDAIRTAGTQITSNDWIAWLAGSPTAIGTGKAVSFHVTSILAPQDDQLIIDGASISDTVWTLTSYTGGFPAQATYIAWKAGAASGIYTASGHAAVGDLPDVLVTITGVHDSPLFAEFRWLNADQVPISPYSSEYTRTF